MSELHGGVDASLLATSRDVPGRGHATTFRLCGEPSRAVLPATAVPVGTTT